MKSMKILQNQFAILVIILTFYQIKINFKQKSTYKLTFKLIWLTFKFILLILHKINI